MHFNKTGHHKKKDFHFPVGFTQRCNYIDREIIPKMKELCSANVYSYLIHNHYAWGNEFLNIKADTLAEKTNLSERSARKGLQNLEAQGLIRVEREPSRPFKVFIIPQTPPADYYKNRGKSVEAPVEQNHATNFSSVAQIFSQEAETFAPIPEKFSAIPARFSGNPENFSDVIKKDSSKKQLLIKTTTENPVTEKSCFLNVLKSEEKAQEHTVTRSDNMSAVDIGQLVTVGVTPKLMQSILNKTGMSDQTLQDSIDAFSFDLFHNKKIETIKNPAAYFSTILLGGNLYKFPSNFKSKEEILREAESLRLLNEKREQEKIIEEKRSREREHESKIDNSINNLLSYLKDCKQDFYENMKQTVMKDVINELMKLELPNEKFQESMKEFYISQFIKEGVLNFTKTGTFHGLDNKYVTILNYWRNNIDDANELIGNWKRLNIKNKFTLITEEEKDQITCAVDKFFSIQKEIVDQKDEIKILDSTIKTESEKQFIHEYDCTGIQKKTEPHEGSPLETFQIEMKKENDLEELKLCRDRSLSGNYSCFEKSRIISNKKSNMEKEKDILALSWKLGNILKNNKIKNSYQHEFFTMGDVLSKKHFALP